MKYFLFLILLIASCHTKKKYYYNEGSKEEVIEASSDSEAYLAAYKNFVISKKVYNDMKTSSFGADGLDVPLSFSLLNKNREDITYKVLISNRDSLENDIEERINGLPNNIKETETKLREEKHGKGAMYDTGGLYLAPVKVLSARFTEKEYSSYKDVALKYKNVSSKPIEAMRFKWYGENAFGEPADMGILSKGWGAGYDDDILRAGATRSSTWGVLCKDGKKILIAYPYEVVFKDGTKWSLNK